MQPSAPLLLMLSVLLVASAALPAPTSAQIDRPNEHFVTRSEVIAANGMVATSQPLATQVGLDVLRRGGNAMDAAIAANAATGLMEPTGNGIGGDLFAIIWHAESETLYGLNASGRSAQSLSYAQLLQELEAKGADSIPAYDLLSISVPGAVDGWGRIHERFGTLPLQDILQDPIRYAEEGFPVSEQIAQSWQRSVPFLLDQIGDVGAFRETFTIDGRGPNTGEIFRNPDLGSTLRLIAQEGPRAFYEGEVADKIDAFMREHGGYLRKADFEAHTSEWVDPVSVNYRGYDVHQIGGNNQGMAVLQMLQILEGYDLASMGHNSEEALHLMLEAKKLAYEDRAKHYADPDFYNAPVERLLSDAYAAERRELIGDRASNRVAPGVEVMEAGDTIYLTTADGDGNMVSLIQSNFRGMGTGFVVPGTGFSFQNRGELFSLDPDHPNVYAPGKRPFHTIIPGFVTRDGAPYFSFGIMGGAYQPMGHVTILTNMIDFGMNTQEAGDAFRWRHYDSTQPTDGAAETLQNGGRVQFESAIDYDIVQGLRQRGHNVRIGGGFYGRYQGIRYDATQGVYYGASESRVDGQAAGY
ncbi:MAG: gamma-glutamyltransferase [Bacteroidetes bacterium]|jgi:gamma-glutamyltranspeptidase/glutathione hydrolase|nr:gamma-glutamyltransferase [Bacteroidota bacterium]